MKRRPRLVNFPIALVALTTLALANTPTAYAQNPAAPPDNPQFRVYDLRDLRAILPAPESPEDEKLSATQRAMIELGNAVGATWSLIADDVYVVGGAPETHTQLAALLDNVRGLYKERYELSLATCFLPITTPVQIGDAAKLDKAGMQRSMIVARRTPTRAGVETRSVIIAGVTPIVAEHAVGYQPSQLALQSGLRVTALVGAGPENNQSTSLMLSGEWTTIGQCRSFTLESAGASPSYRLEFPQVETQLVRSDLRIEFGKPTVVAIVTSPREGECMIIAATVRKLGE